MTLVRLVAGPVVTEDGFRRPLVFDLGFQHASIVGDDVFSQDNDWALSLITCDDWTIINAEPSIIPILPQEADLEQDAYIELLQETPNERGWTDNQMSYFEMVIRTYSMLPDGYVFDRDQPINELCVWLTLSFGVNAVDILQLRVFTDG